MSIRLAKDNLINALVDSSAFQAFVGAGTAMQARARIHKSAAPSPNDGNEYTLDELKKLRPYAVVWSTRYHRTHDGSGGSFEFGAADGGLSILIEQDVAAEIANNKSAIEERFETHLDAIIDDLLAVSGTAGYLAIEELDVPEPYWRGHPNDAPSQGDWIATLINVIYGGGVE